MRSKKFIIGLATATVALPLVTAMSGCAQSTCSNIAKINKTNDNVTARKYKVISANKFVSISNPTMVEGEKYKTTIKVTNEDQWIFANVGKKFTVKCGDIEIGCSAAVQTRFEYILWIESEETKKATGDIQIYSEISHLGEERSNVNYNLDINFETGTFYTTVNDVFPEEPKLGLFDFTLPDEIFDRHKVADRTSSAYWKYKGEDETHKLDIDEYNKVNINFDGIAREQKDVCVYIPLKNIDEQSNISNCSWSDFLFWYRICGQNNLKDFKTMFDLPADTRSDSLIGVERKLKWEGVEHKVRIVDTDEGRYSSIPLAGVNDPEVISDIKHPENNEKADLVFQFANLLTHPNGDVVHSQWHKDETVDICNNCWCDVEGESYDKWKVVDQNKLRVFLKSKTDFLDKFFDDQELINAIKPVYNRRFTRTAKTRKNYVAHWIKDKFFIPTGQQMGHGLWQPGDWNYIYEGEERPEAVVNYTVTEVDTFTYWKACIDDPYRIMYTADTATQTPTTYTYWVASPSHEGSGIGKKEDTIFINCSGGFDHCNVTNSKGYLPCFCL